MADVARLASVSISTVSRAISAPDAVSGELKLRIEKAMQRLSYVPNRVAGSLAATRSRTIGIVIPSVRNSAFAVLVEEVTRDLGADGYQMLIGNSDYSPKEEERLVTSFLSWSAAAMILTGRHHARGTVNKLLAAEIPVVEVWDTSDNAIDSAIGFSHYDAGRHVADYFINKGLTRLGVVGAALDLDLRAGQRAAAFRETVARRLGAPAILRSVPNRSEATDGSSMLAAILEAQPDTEAVFFTNDILAIGGLFECQRRGIRVPDDLRLCGFGASTLTEASLPTLSTIRPPRAEIGRQTADLLLARLSGDKQAGEIIDLGYQHIIRESG